ncbi:MAG TPA: cytochrome c3 family protein [Anaeromyxobacteraceae bacterium]|nr:cytochrome c3 family protein [Anaeromyxobacteraceae bacterium]
MTRFLRIAIALATAAAAGCGSKDRPPDWVTVTDRASHEAMFPIATGFHAAADCNDCHGGFDTFKQFTCTTCHAEPQNGQLHAGVSGYASDGPSCVRCHPLGTIGVPPNHGTAFFPIGSGTAHADVACSQCHLDMSRANDPTAFGCYACHSALPTGWPHPTSVGNVAILTVHTSQNASQPVDLTDPATCLRCHADSQVDSVASHPASGGFGRSEHAAAGCLTCHSGTRTDKTFGTNFSTTPAAGSGSGCGTCHATDPVPANHATALFPIGTGTAHENVDCAQCHLDMNTPRDPAAFGCYACHSTLPTGWPHPSTVATVAILTVHTSENASHPIDITDPATCLRCHADSQVDAVASHPGGGDSIGRSQHAAAGCLTCHSAMRTDKTFGANFDATPPVGSGTGCGTCHSTQPN